MKALYYPKWDHLEIREVAEPILKAGEVLVRVKAAGICGSEVHSFLTHAVRRTPPLIMGHEFCGVIVEVGDGVSAYRGGDRITANSIVSCGQCGECLDGRQNLCGMRQVLGMHRPGGFAEYCAVPASAILPLPDTISDVHGALVEPLANVIHALSFVEERFPANVVIVGAGTIGLLLVQVTRLTGIVDVVCLDVSDARLSAAHELGARRTVNPRTAEVEQVVRDYTGGRGADLVIEAVGAIETRRIALAAARPGGEIIWVGLHEDATQLSGFDVVLGERKIIGSSGLTPRDMRVAIRLLSQGKIIIEPWVRSFPLVEGPRVFHQFMSPPHDEFVKAVLLP